MNTLELPFPVEAARRIIPSENWSEAHKSCQKIVLDEKRTSDLGRVLHARHRVVAQIVFDKEIEGARTTDEAEAFAGDAAKVLWALKEIRAPLTRRAIDRVASQFVHHPKFADVLKGADALGDLPKSICLFDELVEGVGVNNFVPKLVAHWRNERLIPLSHLLLKEVVANVGWPACRSFPACCDAFAEIVCYHYPHEVEATIDLLTRVKESLDGKLRSWVLVNALSKLHEFKGGGDALTAAINLLSAHLPHCDGDILGPTVMRLSLLRESRAADGDIDKAVEELEKAADIKPPLPDLAAVVIRLSQVLEKRGTTLNSPRDLRYAIIRIFLAMRIKPRLPDWGELVIQLSQRLMTRGKPNDLRTAIFWLVKAAHNKPPLPDLAAVLLRLSKVLRMRQAEGDLRFIVEHIEGYLEQPGEAPQTPKLLVELGEVLQLENPQTGLGSAIEKIEQRIPNLQALKVKGWLLFKLSFLYEKQGNLSKARSKLEEAKSNQVTPKLAQLIEERLVELRGHQQNVEMPALS
jgi:tetratricopeptide (TPR) repeat protein